MPQLIEKGYLYIAQPPLYQVKRGNGKAVYLKDDTALEEYCVDAALRDAVFRQHEGGQRAGNDLRDLVERARPAPAAAGADAPKWAASTSSSRRRSPARCRRRSRRAEAGGAAHRRAAQPARPPPTGSGGRSRGRERHRTGDLIFSRNRQGVSERRVLDAALLRTARPAASTATPPSCGRSSAGKLVALDKEYRVTGPVGWSRR